MLHFLPTIQIYSKKQNLSELTIAFLNAFLFFYPAKQGFFIPSVTICY